MPLKSEARLSEGTPSSPSDRLALAGWLDDGGSSLQAASRPARKPRSPRQPGDTAEGCRNRAAADLLAAAAMSTRNGTLRMEASSASWSARAEMLQRIDNSYEARMKSEALMRQDMQSSKDVSIIG